MKLVGKVIKWYLIADIAFWAWIGAGRFVVDNRHGAFDNLELEVEEAIQGTKGILEFAKRKIRREGA